MDSDEARDQVPDLSQLWPQSGQDLLSTEGPWTQIACVGWLKHDWHGHAYSFRRSAEIIYENASRSTGELDTAFLPMAFLWRHYVELTLKRKIALLQSLLDLPLELMRTHKIDVLWRAFRPLAESAHPHEPVADLDNVEATLRQLDALDPNAEDFRYPVRMNGAPTLEGVDRVDLVQFHDAMVRAANWLDAGFDMIDDELQLKAEYESEYGEYDW